MNLTDRQMVILKTVVEEFTRTAQPVGSKSLIPLLPIPVSSATIRNEFAVLEKEGLIEKTHSSSGRVPSLKGYRFYVEHLMELSLDPMMQDSLREVFSKRHVSLEDTISTSCDILAQMTHLTSMVFEPRQSDQRLVSLSLIPINEHQAVAVVVTTSGQTQHRLFNFEEGVSIEDLKSCTKMLNDKLTGIPLDKLIDEMEKIRPEIAAHVSRHEVLFEAFISAFMGFASERSKVYGRANMLVQPEFADPGKLEDLMRALEDRQLFQKWALQPDNVSTRIDERNRLIQIGDCSVICTSFDTGAHEEGQLMVIGPSRMPYSKVIALMDYLSEQIERTFSVRLEGGRDDEESD